MDLGIGNLNKCLERQILRAANFCAQKQKKKIGKMEDKKNERKKK
jgi:hypothetical protein